MNSLSILLIAIGVFLLAFRFIGKSLEKLFDVRAENPTPAYTCGDNCDYIPAKNWLVLFGHHFSSIAGAGPIIGPVLAVIFWGWGPAIFWVILGSVLLGGIHDFSTLMVSVREEGVSIATVGESYINKTSRIIFSGFVWLALLLVDVVFLIYAARTFVTAPTVIFPALGLIPVAILVGLMLYQLRLNLLPATFIGLFLLVVLLFAGQQFPVKASFQFWTIILLIYVYVASVTPVNILLQPRDYLSSYLLFSGIVLGVIGVIMSNPAMDKNSFLVGKVAGGAGGIFPFVFVTIACGAISGFHSLISSGTTSKQLGNEKDARKIGYGAMLMEGLVAIIAIVAIAGALSSSGQVNWTEMLKNPIIAYGRGYQLITEKFLKGYGFSLAIIILNAFILTTLDTATRITRYITQELFGVKNKYLSTLVITFLIAIFAFSGQGERIWQIFGASNQLIGALSLLVVTVWLKSHQKNIFWTVFGAIFMFLMTTVALIELAIRYQKDYLLLSICVILVILALAMAVNAFPKVFTGRNSVK